MESLAIVQLAIGIFAGVVVLVGHAHQISTMVKKKSAKDLSWGLPLAGLIHSMSWFAFAVLMACHDFIIQDCLPPLLLGGLEASANLTTMCLKRRYDSMQSRASCDRIGNASECDLDAALRPSSRDVVSSGYSIINMQLDSSDVYVDKAMESDLTHESLPPSFDLFIDPGPAMPSVIGGMLLSSARTQV